jgi:hypothetical protein
MWTERCGSLRPLDPGAIPEKKPYRRVKLFGSGELARFILGALRKAEKPLTAGDVTSPAVVNELGHGPEARKGMANLVRANLNYLTRERGLAAKEGDRASARWSLQPNRAS